ncbi:unnamed protein product, partial [Arabis nemorensis]
MEERLGHELLLLSVSNPSERLGQASVGWSVDTIFTKRNMSISAYVDEKKKESW